jgi:[ribosomal protein S5]-alanine N-acetyltransferase
MISRNFTSFPILTTERLTLRQLVATDEQAIFNLRSDTEINKFLDRKIADSLDDAKQFINIVNKNIDNNTSIYWGVTFSGKSELMGTICLFGFSDESDKCEIGYELLTNFQRQGVMQEAAEEVIDYAFNTIGVQKIEAFFHRDNQRSKKLLEKFSFKNSTELDKTDPDLVCYYLKSANNNRK